MATQLPFTVLVALCRHNSVSEGVDYVNEKITIYGYSYRLQNAKDSLCALGYVPIRKVDNIGTYMELPLARVNLEK